MSLKGTFEVYHAIIHSILHWKVSNTKNEKNHIRFENTPRRIPTSTCSSIPYLCQTLRSPKNHECLGCATQNLPPQYSGTGGGTPSGHTQILRPRNL